jgi:hypothetical protein
MLGQRRQQYKTADSSEFSQHFSSKKGELAVDVNRCSVFSKENRSTYW